MYNHLVDFFFRPPPCLPLLFPLLFFPELLLSTPVSYTHLFAYIIFSYIRLCTKLDTLLWRNQLFLFFSVFFIVMTLSLFFVNGFSINSFAGNRVLLLCTSMNMYTFYLQYMYSLPKEERDRVQRGQI